MGVNRTAACSDPAARRAGVDVSGGDVRTQGHRGGLSVASADRCCAECALDLDCRAWVFGEEAGAPENCWLLADFKGTAQSAGRVFGTIGAGAAGAV